jgi:hypothetical protein
LILQLQRDRDMNLEIKRRCLAEDAFKAWLRKPEREQLRELDTRIASPTLEDLYPLFLGGAAFQRLDDVFAGTRLDTNEARRACERWITTGKHASIIEPPAPIDASDVFESPEPDHSREFHEHELFAVFRAGARYAATGNPFRAEEAWSVPAASPDVQYVEDDNGTGDIWLRNAENGNIVFIPADFRSSLRWVNAAIGATDAGGAFEILAHVSEGTDPNTGDIACTYYPVSGFEGLRRVTRDSALASHPEFKVYLDTLNAPAERDGT